MTAIPTRRLLGWLAVILGLLSAAELTARHLLPRVASATEEPRNPYRFRGWPEYTRADRAPAGTGRLVLLSNSQAVAGELRPHHIYAVALAQRLTELQVGGFTNWQVLNWSVEGMTSMEYMLLAARARQAQPDAVLLAAGMPEFRTANLTNGILFSRSDIHRLATRPSLMRHLPRAFLRRHYNLEDALTATARDRLALVRYRDFFWNWLDLRWPGVQPAFYAPLNNFHPWGLKKIKTKARLGPVAWLPQDQSNLDYSDDCRLLVEETLRQVSLIEARLKLVISVPVRDQAHEGAHGEKLTLFLRHMAESSASVPGLSYTDLHALIPPDGFMDGAHLRGRYHAVYGQRLADEVAQRWTP